MKKNVSSFCNLLILILIVGACGSSSRGGLSSIQSRDESTIETSSGGFIISGKAFKGPISGGTVSVYKINKSGGTFLLRH